MQDTLALSNQGIIERQQREWIFPISGVLPIKKKKKEKTKERKYFMIKYEYYLYFVNIPKS